MNRSAEQALLSLLPTLTTELPPQLVELSGSLLAQSRHRASTLKPEEDIARPYACAHLACERLKITLNLPPIDASRPPVPPRIYSRLYSYLERVLPASISAGAASKSNPSTPSGASAAGRTRTPSSKLRDSPQQQRRRDGTASGTKRSAPASPQVTPSSGRRTAGLPSQPSPAKAAALARFRSGGGATTPKKRPAARGTSAADDGGRLPPWVRPTIRHLCRALHDDDEDKDDGRDAALGRRMAPTVFAGVEAILGGATSRGRPGRGGGRSGKRQARDENEDELAAEPAGPDDGDDEEAWLWDHLAALVGAVCLVVSAELHMQRTGGRLGKVEYVARRNSVLKVLGEARREVEIKGSNAEDGETEKGEPWEGWRAVDAREMAIVTARIINRGWLAADWYVAIKELARAGDEGREGGEGDVGAEGVDVEEDDVMDGVQQAGSLQQLGRGDSMLQPKYDFLGEEKRRKYKAWEQAILSRIDELEREGGAAVPIEIDV